MCGALVSNHRELSYFYFLPTLLFDSHETCKMHAMAVHFPSRGVECLCKLFALIVTILSLEGNIERSQHEALSTCAHKMWIIVLKLGKLTRLLDFNVIRIFKQLIK